MNVIGLCKSYYQLTKPGIIYGNSLTAAAGFLLAAEGDIDAWLLAATIAGIALVIASGCVFNNCIDREIDARMARTKKRALVIGAISSWSAILYGMILGIAGFFVLAVYANPLASWLVGVGFFVYIFSYGIGKRRGAYGTVVGSVAGAIPITAGYCAASGMFDMGAGVLFLVLALWQMPHFYAIAIFRGNDYTAARLPVLPVVAGRHVAKIHIILYIFFFMIATAALTAFDYAGYTYLVGILVLGAWWLRLAVHGLESQDEASDVQWARKVFGRSLMVLLGLSLLLASNAWLP